MGVDPVSIAAIVISSITAVGAVITGLHIRRMHSGCLDCDCVPQSPLRRKSTVKFDQGNTQIMVLAQPPLGKNASTSVV